MEKREFFAQAVQREADTEHAYRQLAELVIAEGRLDVMEFFHQMAEYARMHRESMLRHAAAAEITLPLTDMPPDMPAGEIPPSLKTDEIPAELMTAMELALECEQAGLAFYESIATSDTDPLTRDLAEAFVAEERQHVEALQRFMGIKAY